MSKLDSKAIYRAVRDLGTAWADARGFEINGTGSQWVKRLPGERTFSLQFQSDKWGFDERSGNQFTLNLRVFEPDAETILLSTRYGRLLDDRDRVVMAEVHRGIMARRARDPDEDELDARSTDPWLRAYDEQDVRVWWTELLEPRLDRMCERFLETGGARPTPVTKTISLPSLELTDHRGSATISLLTDDAETLARGLQTLTTASPMFSVVKPSTHFIFERRDRYHSGIARVEALGIAQRRRVWIELGPKALDELANLAARAQAATVTLLESSHLELEIRPS